MHNLLINEPPLMVLPSLACLIGLNEAMVLQQIHYWLNPRINKNHKEGYHWVFNSYEQWQQQFPFWSTVTIKRTVQSLEKTGLLISKNLNSSGFDKTKWYRIDYNKLEALSTISSSSYKKTMFSRIGQNDPIEKIKGNTSLVQNDSVELIKQNDGVAHSDPFLYRTEITTETTNPPQVPQTPAKEKLEEGEEEREIAKRMLKEWDSIVRREEGTTFLKPERTRNLLSVLSFYFANDLTQWKKYCLKIASSKFLMGETKEKFQVKIDWIIKPESIEKILEGSITTGDRETRELPASKEDSYTIATQKYSLLSPEELNQHKEDYVLYMKTKNPAFNEESLNGDQFWIKSFKHFVITKIIKEIESSQLTVKSSFH